MNAPVLESRAGRVKCLSHPDSAAMPCNEKQSPRRTAKDSDQDQLTLDLSETNCLDGVLPRRELQEALAHAWLGPGDHRP